VLGLVAVIAGWAASAAYEDMLSLRRAENSQATSRAELASASVLALAKQGLIHDAKISQTDDLDEEWAQPTPPFPVDDGLVSATLEDANRYLNVNDLVDAQGVAAPAVVQLFKRLFLDLQLEPSLVDALVDWIDVDTIPSGVGGAEDNSYFDQPYRVKNTPLDRWQELQMVRGFDAKTVHLLEAYLRVWPVVGNMSHVNINTAHQTILLNMFPLMNSADAMELLNGRPYSALTMQSAAWAQGAEAQAMFSRLSVVSDTFIVRTHAIFGHADWQEVYGLARQGVTITALWRERILWQMPIPSNKVGQP